MALKHKTVGTDLSQTEWEQGGGHLLDSQATGDMIYADAATTMTRLAIGTTDQVLVESSGIPAWSDVLRLPVGSVSAVAYGFTGDPNTGWYATGADAAAFAVGGVQAFTVTTTGVVFNEGSADRDFRVESDGSADALSLNSGLRTGGAWGFGDTPSANFWVVFRAPAHTYAGGSGAIAIARFRSDGMTFDTGNQTGVVSTVMIDEPNVTEVGIDISTAASLYVASAPNEADDNYAALFDSGLVRVDGDGTDVFELPADATDPTSGGGAATGRIPVKIGGSTVYLAYY